MDEGKSNKWLDLLANSKQIAMGILVVLSLIGAVYGSFRPEVDARAGYNTLAPELIDVATITDNNTLLLDKMRDKVTRLEGQMEVMIHGGCKPESTTPKPIPKKESNPRPEPRPAPEPELERLPTPKPNRKTRDLTPPWEKQRTQ